MKAAPLLRAWLHRLRHPAQAAGVQFHMRHRWLGWADDGAHAALRNARRARCRCRPTPWCWRWAAAAGRGWAPTAPGCRCWPRAAWRWRRCCRPTAVSMWRCSASCRPGQTCRCRWCRRRTGWSELFASRFAGQPFKSVAIRFTDAQGRSFQRKGEFVATATGVEGSLIYAASSLLRDEIIAHRQRHASRWTCCPTAAPEQVLAEVAHPRGSRSLSSHLKSRLGHRRHQGGHAARAAEQGRRCTTRRSWPQPSRRCRCSWWRPGRSTRPSAAPAACSSRRWTPDLMLRGAARRVLRRRDAGLGSAHRRLPADGLFCQWLRGRAGCAALSGCLSE